MAAMCQDTDKNTKADIIATFKGIGRPLRSKGRIFVTIGALSPFVLNVKGKGRKHW
jgi:hypothetical protein